VIKGDSMVPYEGLRVNLFPCLFPTSGLCLQSLVLIILGLKRHHPLSQGVFPVCVSVSKSKFPLIIRLPVIRAHPNDFILT
jgi:hypothetical protein